MPSNFDPSIQNLLAAAPFFDDWDDTKNYYRILFRPGVAVQTREVNQLQTIAQNQLSEFASTVYKNGSVVEGCSIEYIPNLEWVTIADHFVNNSALAQDDESLTNAVVVGNTSGVQAYLVSTQAGFASQNPGKFFIRYTAPGATGNTKFIPGEYLNVYNANASYVEDIVLTCNSAVTGFVGSEGDVVQCVQTGNTANVLATGVIVSVNTSAQTITVNNIQDFFETGQSLILLNAPSTNTGINSFVYDTGTLIGSINMLCSGSDPYIASPANGVLTTNAAFTNADASGYSYGAFISEGVVYQSGFFVNVDPQTIVVNPNTATPANYSLGFVTSADIITEDIDSSLNDNALGYPNFNAPGAYRLKLTANLVSVLTESLASNSTFFPIVQFSNTGAVFEKLDPQYSALGDALAERTYDEAGHFIIQPFLVSSNSNPADANTVLLTVQPGLAYVEGERIQMLSSLDVVERRGTDTASSNDVVITTSYGNYVPVKEIAGYFPQDTEVVLYDATQAAVSGGKTSTTAPSGNQIGTAVLRELISTQSLQGQPNSISNAYLFDVAMANNSVSFSSAKSIVYVSSGNNAFADIAANATLIDSSYTSLLFSIGSSATKSLTNANGTADSSYYFMASVPVSMDTTGKVAFAVPVAGEQLGFGIGVATQAELQYITLTMTSNTQSVNVATNAVAFANGLITCASPSIGSSIFYPGDVIKTSGGAWLVSSVINATALQTTCTIANAATTIARIEQQGRTVPLDGVTRNVTFSNTTAGFANVGLSYTGTANAVMTFYALRTNATQTAKQINRSTTVLIQPANTGTDSGPWCLGLPDILDVVSVYKMSSANVTDVSNNCLSDFVVDNGQQDGYYELGSIRLAPTANAALYANQMLVVLVDHFTPNNSTGSGFFSIDSYPVDDSVSANTLATIRTAEIPTYNSSSQQTTYNLRDCVDFRPYKTATANIGNALATATLNPATSNTFDAKTTGQTPFPSGNFICNSTHYVGRKDLLLLSSSGSFNIAEGVPSLTPRMPGYDANTNLALATITVPPYPSLPSNEQQNYPNAPTDYDLSVSLQNHRRYTMNDISSLDQRISQLEYYVTLNALENAAASTTTINGNGQQQFQNGIFVDPMSSHAFGRTELPQYQIAIDTQNSYARPLFYPWFIELQFSNNNSQNIQQTGDSLSIAYDSVPYISQNYATDQRFLSGMPPTFAGEMSVYPDFWSEIEAFAPAASISSDGTPATSALAQMAGPPLTMDFGWWRQSVQTSLAAASNSESNSLRSATILSGNENSPGSYSINDTTYIDVSVKSYISSKQLAVVANGLKPYTQFNIYIDSVLANKWAAPGSYNSSGKTSDDSLVTRTGTWGNVLQSDSRGNLYAKLSIPTDYFMGGQHVVTVLDATIDAVTNEPVSGAAAVFIADIVYQVPPPAPPPSLPPPTTPIVKPNTAPSASFNLASGTASLTTVSPTFPTLSFKDTSVKGSNPISQWTWDFGDGSTQTVASAGQTVSHTYSDMVTNTQQVNVTLKVRDSAGLTSSVVGSYKLGRLVPALPPPSPNIVPQITAYIETSGIAPPAGNVWSSQLGSIVSDTATASAGFGVVFEATSSNNVPGAYWTWTHTPISGANTVENNVWNAPSNNQFWAFLQNSSSNVSSKFSVKATYMNSGVSPAPNVSMTLTMTSTVAVPPPMRYGGGGGGCADVQSYTPFDNKLIGEYFKDDLIQVCRHKDLNVLTRRISRAFQSMQPCYRLHMACGATVVISSSTPLEGHDYERFLPEDSINKQLPVMDARQSGKEPNIFWDTIVKVEPLDERLVNRISLSGQDLCYWAGEQPDFYVSVHNVSGRRITIKKE